jgi:uncharacterized membrane protein
MSTYEVLLFLHLVGVLLIFAGDSIALGLAALGTARTRSTAVIAWSIRAQITAVRVGTLPGGVIAVIFGSWLVTETHHEFGDAWVSASFGLVIATVAIGLGVLLPHRQRVLREAETQVESGVTESEELRRSFVTTPWAIATLFEVGADVAFLYLMVFRPGG